MERQSPTPEPAKKYWWAVGIVVPITVALIGLLGQWHKQDTETGAATGRVGTQRRGMERGKAGDLLLQATGKSRKRSLSLRIRDGSDQEIPNRPGPLVTRIAVSPDDRTTLYPQTDQEGSVLMLVENFR